MEQPREQDFTHQQYDELYQWLTKNTDCAEHLEGIAQDELKERISTIKNCEFNIETEYEIPSSVKLLTGLKKMSINDFQRHLMNDLEQPHEKTTLILPESISSLTTLEELIIKSNYLDDLPKDITNLTNLSCLQLHSDCLRSIPIRFENLLNLTELILDIPNVVQIPESIGELYNLKTFHIHSKGLFPSSISKLISLESLAIVTAGGQTMSEEDFITHLESIKDLPSLKTLIIKSRNLKTLPEWVASFQNIKYLESEYLYLDTLPPFLRKLENLTNLSLVNCGLNEIPEWISELNSLQEMNLRGNSIYKLPMTMRQMKNLRFIYFDEYIQMMLTEEQLQSIQNALPPQCKIELIA